MENQIRIVLLCGGRFAFEAIKLLAFEKYLCGVGIGKGDPVVVDALESKFEESDLFFQSFPTQKSLMQMRTWLDEIKPDYVFSVSFPFLLTTEILSYGSNKFINFHPGLLPQYRGPMPIFETIRNSEKATAVSVHYMNESFDEGDLIFADSIELEKDETYGSLAFKLGNHVAQIALNVANMLQFSSKMISTPQNSSEAYYYEKPSLSDTFINWKRMDAEEVIALIKACNPWNIGADTTLGSQKIKIIAASLTVDEVSGFTPGTIVSISNDTIDVVCSDAKVIAIELLQTDHGILSSQKYIKKHSLLGNVFV